MRESNRKILNTLLAIDIGIILFCMLSGHRSWLYTTQIGFFSSALVIAASMVSYRRMIERRVAEGDTLPGDTLEQIDDPHALYDEEPEEQESELSREAFAEVVREEKEKQRARRRSITQVIKDSRASLSIYRIGAYLLLITGFFYLNRHHYLHIPSYLFALSVPPVVTVILLMRENRVVSAKKEISDEVR